MDDMADWYGPDMATFGDRLAAAREQAGLKQSELARKLGVRTNTLKSWEEDLSEPRANRLSMLAGLLNVSVTWLINGQGEGMQGPPETETTDPTLQDFFREIRDLRADLQSRSEQVGRLEKRLRKVLSAHE